MNTQMKTLMSQRIFNSNTCRILFATCLSALCLAALSAEAATITVAFYGDSGPGSLRQALAVAHDGDRITFAVSGTITLTSGELKIAHDLTIQGRSTLDQKKRGDIYVRAQKLLFDDAAYVYKWGLRGVWGISNRVNYEAPPDEVDRMALVTPRKK